MEQQRISDYLHSLEKDAKPLLAELRSYAGEHNVPIVRRETESFLRTVCAAKKPGRILEIGTAVAYSTIVLAECGADVVTVENYEKRIPLARANLERARLTDKVRLIPEDAGPVLKRLAADGEKFDLIFLDAAKGQYCVWLEDIRKLLPAGGILIADNVLQDCTVMESRFTVDRRERTTHERMREFLYRIMHDPGLESSVIPLGDGVSLSVRL